MTPEQIPLDMPLPRRRARGRSSFLVGRANADALRLIDGWRAWPDGRLLLIGPEGAGKTHLAHVWLEESGAEKLAAAALSAQDAPALVAAGAVCVEDVDRAAGDAAAERGLFHLINLSRESGAPLLMTGGSAPKFWPFVTLDLASRVQATSVAALEAPDDALLMGLAAKLFRDRHLNVAEDVATLIVRRAGRSAADVAAIVARLDEAALASGRSITARFARETLKL